MTADHVLVRTELFAASAGLVLIIGTTSSTEEVAPLVKVLAECPRMHNGGQSREM